MFGIGSDLPGRSVHGPKRGLGWWAALAVRVELRRDLNAVVAKQIRPKVEALAREIAAEAVPRAPGAKVWVTRDDARVRPSHAANHLTMIPANIQYRLPKVRGPGYDLAFLPRDRRLPANQVLRCRCENVPVPGVIAARIKAGPAVVAGDRVTARVSVEFPRISEAEFGSGDARGLRFMGSAIDVVAARLRAASARRSLRAT